MRGVIDFARSVRYSVMQDNDDWVIIETRKKYRRKHILHVFLNYARFEAMVYDTFI